MGRFEWDWFIGWTCATTMVLGIVTMIYFGVQSSNEKYYASMDKCTAAGGTFIPTGGQSGAICLMGVKQ
jgi:hypothetical protein